MGGVAYISKDEHARLLARIAGLEAALLDIQRMTYASADPYRRDIHEIAIKALNEGRALQKS